MTFLEHFGELRVRLIVSFVALCIGSVVAFLLFDRILVFLLRPLEQLRVNDLQHRVFVNTLTEGFTTKLKVSVLGGAVLTVPVHLYNVIRFVFPGLSSRERRVILAGLGASFLLSAISICYSYLEIVPLTIRFLSSGKFVPFQVGMLLNYQKSVFYILQFILLSLLVFQSPIALELLLVLNVVHRRSLLKASRHVIVVIFLLSALLTPPDVVSQLVLAAPLVLLFFLTILVARVFRFGEQ